MAKKVAELNADDFLKAVELAQKRAPDRILKQNRANALIVRRIYQKKIDQEARGKKGKLKKGMTLDKPEKDSKGWKQALYNNSKKAPHYHLVERGHNLVKKDARGRKNVIGFVSGKYYFERSCNEAKKTIEEKNKKWALKVFKELG